MKQKLNLKKSIRYGLSSCLLMLGSNSAVAQNPPNLPANCGGVLPSINTVAKTVAANCTASSPAYTNKYALQSNYVPTANSPVIILKITFHVIQNTNGTAGPWLGASGITGLSDAAAWMHNQFDRYSYARNATYSTGTLLSNNYINDSKINYELTNIYVYNDDAMNMSTNDNDIMTYLNTQHPGVLDEGMPIIISSGNSSGGAGYQSSYNGAPYIHTSVWQDSWFLQSHLRHEIGHAFGLYHTYQASCCPENLDCTNPDFLSDVFPINNTMCASGSSPCNACYEAPPNTSNNLMSGGQNDWISPLQMGRRNRNMHLIGTGIRKFAKEMTSSIIAPWLITANEIWDFDIQMYEDIVVKSGSTLTIKCKVGMANNGRIVVERGAKLIIDGGEVYAWGSNWSGIQVWGNSAQPQTIVSGLAPNQGIVDVINQGTIRDAAIGISTGKFFDNGDIDWGGYFGGIIRCNNAKFINNWKGVGYLTYHNKNSIGNTINNIGYFYNTLFETNSVLKDPNNQYPDAFVSLWAVEGVKFYGNTYRNTNPTVPSIDKRGNGINSYDASYIIDRYKSGCTLYNYATGCTAWSTNNASTFTNLHYGVYVQNASPFSNVKVNDNDFVGCNRGVYIGGTLHSSLTNNRINVGLGAGTTNTTFLPYGIYSDNSSAYDISNNTIFTTYAPSYGLSDATGIVVNASNGTDNTIYRNNMNRMSAGTTVYGDNQGATVGAGLKLKCNSYGQGSTGLNLLDINMGIQGFTNGRIDKMQGSTNKGANNLFSHTNSTAYKTDFNDRFQTGIPSSNPAGSFNYYFNLSAATTPVYYDPTLVPYQISGQPLNYANMCPVSLFDVTIGTGGPKTVAYAQQVIAVNTASIVALNAKIDGGNTQALVSTINSTISAGNLKNTMEQNSPYLSDAVLIAYFSKANTPNGHIKDIHDKNKPVSMAVWQTILNRNLPKGIMQDLNQQQATTIQSAMQVLYGQIADLNQQKGFIVDEVTRTLLSDTINGIDEQSIIALMKADNRYESQCRLLSGYVAMGKYAEATTLIADIKTAAGGTLDEFCKLQELLITLKQQTSNVYSIKTDMATKATLEQIAACDSRQCNEAYSNAQALLKQVFNYKYSEYMSLPTAASTSRLGNTKEEVTSALISAKLFKVYPNPASSVINVELLMDDSKQYQIELMNMLGELVLTQPLTSNNSTLKTNNLPRGLYLVNLVADGRVIDKQKLIIE